MGGMGGSGEELSGTCIKDTWTKPKGVGSRVGSGDGWGGGSRGGKWRELSLNNNKKCGKIKKSEKIQIKIYKTNICHKKLNLKRSQKKLKV